MSKYQKLRDLINGNETLVVPDAYDGISARLIEAAGFKAVQCSGYSFSISKKYAKESLVSLDENLSMTEGVVKAVSVPVFADGEDGYGSGDIFLKNMERFYKTGIAGINIEDQNLWNDFIDEKLLPVAESVKRIKAVRKMFPDLVINARTDAINVPVDRQEGIRTAIDRANAFYEAGADLCFTTGVRTKEEIQLLNKEIRGPITIAAGLPYNIENFSINDCKEIGIARVSLPTTLIFASIQSQLDILKTITEKGDFSVVRDRLVGMEKLQDILGK